MRWSVEGDILDLLHLTFMILLEVRQVVKSIFLSHRLDDLQVRALHP
jgi:hypothetical protein